MPSKKTPATLAGVLYFMTDRKITYALNRIRACKENKYPLEALIRTYHLNADLVKFLLTTSSENYSSRNKKIKVLLHDFLEAIDSNPDLKMIIHKRSVKTLRPWSDKMDRFFKDLKLRYPSDLSALQEESEKIFGLLKISANKLFVQR